VLVVQKVNMDVSAALSESPIEKVKVAGRSIYIKRDDLLNPYFSGNKARKFATYLEPNNTNITHLVSYGSIQANSLYSLAALAHLKGWQLYYYVSRIPSWLKGSTLGNYGQAIALGAKIIEVELSNTKNLDSTMREMANTLPSTSLFIPEGGRNSLARIGVSTLAKEIAEYCNTHHIFETHSNAQIMLPSGTGTTALFLQTWFKENNIPIKVLTCPCVGDTTYLAQQFSELNADKTQWPTILPNSKKYHFGKLNKNHYLIWQKLLQETGIEFELLYDPIGWQCLLEYLSRNKESTVPIFYLHQGGLIGNQTMLPRYKRKYPDLF
jgi:1-aminocyclopropane-1-carboxylate deaminase/D-cysteine desulfhydrase-like pyridoxal-dependent ACC family enzyme